jgi:predicted transcriptional regulator
MYSQNHKINDKKPKINGFNLAQRLYTSGIAAAFDLNPTQILVLIGLASHFNPDKSVVFPSQEYLAKKLNISERSVVRAINELIKKRLIVKSKNGNNNLYAFTAIFFEAAGMSADTRQSDTPPNDNLTHKQYNSNYKNNTTSFFQKNTNSPNSLSNLEEHIKRKNLHEQTTRLKQTTQYIENQKSIKTGSPLDFDKEQALEYIKNLGEFASNSSFAKQLKTKWNL